MNDWKEEVKLLNLKVISKKFAEETLEKEMDDLDERYGCHFDYDYEYQKAVERFEKKHANYIFSPDEFSNFEDFIFYEIGINKKVERLTKAGLKYVLNRYYTEKRYDINDLITHPFYEYKYLTSIVPLIAERGHYRYLISLIKMNILNSEDKEKIIKAIKDKKLLDYTNLEEYLKFAKYISPEEEREIAESKLYYYYNNYSKDNINYIIENKYINCNYLTFVIELKEKSDIFIKRAEEEDDISVDFLIKYCKKFNFEWEYVEKRINNDRRLFAYCLFVKKAPIPELEHILGAGEDDYTYRNGKETKVSGNGNIYQYFYNMFFYRSDMDLLHKYKKLLIKFSYFSYVKKTVEYMEKYETIEEYLNDNDNKLPYKLLSIFGENKPVNDSWITIRIL